MTSQYQGASYVIRNRQYHINMLVSWSNMHTQWCCYVTLLFLLTSCLRWWYHCLSSCSNSVKICTFHRDSKPTVHRQHRSNIPTLTQSYHISLLITLKLSLRNLMKSIFYFWHYTIAASYHRCCDGLLFYIFKYSRVVVVLRICIITYSRYYQSVPYWDFPFMSWYILLNENTHTPVLICLLG